MSRTYRQHVNTLVLSLMLAAGGVGAAGAQTTNPEWQPGGRAKAWVRGMVGPMALLGIAAASAVDQVRNDPPEWGDDAGGLGRRVASNAGRTATQETIRHGLAAVMDRSVVYQHCTCTGVGPRLGHAFLEAITDRSRDGDRRISIPRFVGAYGGAALEKTWRPGRTAIDLVSLGTSTIFFSGLGYAWSEFVGWP